LNRGDEFVNYSKFLAVFGVAVMFSVVGCGEAMSESEIAAAEEESIDVQESSLLGPTTAVQASGDPYTPFTSEELPQVACRNGYVAVGADCEGSYCDNYRLRCVKFPAGTIGASEWSPWFENDGLRAYKCPGKSWVTGVACDGSYCDNISLRCTDMGKSADTATCDWSFGYDARHSEEHFDPYLLPADQFMKGAKCEGQHCDDKDYYSCRPL
jgi:hypothetical protein